MACQDCVTGSLHEGTPVGREEKLHGLPTYVTDPPNGGPPAANIVIVSDVFGWKLPNTRLLADTYAKRGNYRVYVPEFMNGHYLDYSMLDSMNTATSPSAPAYKKIIPGMRTGAGFAPFFFFNRASVTMPRVHGFLKGLRAADPGLPLGAAGFCWGGKVVAVLCADEQRTDDGRSLLDAGFVAHPANMTVPSDAEKVKLPISLTVGTLDFSLKADGIKKIQELWGARKDGKEEITVVEGARHGFGIRADRASEEEAKQALLAEDQAIAWFAKWLGKKEVQ
ncbi:hypothetical protein MMC07_004176 [Pseudocyphellaria aurata]|nr:hypothetical protein [Pseudocyphellaria aurata]